MKKIIKSNFILLSLLALMSAFAFTSCKDCDGSPDIKAGTPVLTSITPNDPSGGDLVTVIGTGLGDMTSIVFAKEDVPATVVSTLNTETCILFRVPQAVNGGVQNVTFTNRNGKTMVTSLNVQAPAQVVSVSDYNFTEGTELTLTGYNFNDVSGVVLTGTSTAVTVVSKTRNTMVIKMPATTLSRATLDITNVTGTTTTTQEFVCYDNNFLCYTDAYGPGAFNGGIQNWGWGCTTGEVTTQYKNGTKSLKVTYTDGGLSLFLGSDTWADGHWFTDFFTAKYLTFWAKGEGAVVALTIVDDSPPWGGTFPGGTVTLAIPADTWTYFKVDAAATWRNPYGRIDFKAKNATVYFDDIIYVK
jgi:hypothetical protein